MEVAKMPIPIAHNGSKHYKISEVCQFLGISRDAVTRKLNSLKISQTVIGQSAHISISDTGAWLGSYGRGSRLSPDSRERLTTLLQSFGSESLVGRVGDRTNAQSDTQSEVQSDAQSEVASQNHPTQEVKRRPTEERDDRPKKVSRVRKATPRPKENQARSVAESLDAFGETVFDILNSFLIAILALLSFVFLEGFWQGEFLYTLFPFFSKGWLIAGMVMLQIIFCVVSLNKKYLQKIIRWKKTEETDFLMEAALFIFLIFNLIMNYFRLFHDFEGIWQTKMEGNKLIEVLDYQAVAKMLCLGLLGTTIAITIPILLKICIEKYKEIKENKLQ